MRFRSLLRGGAAGGLVGVLFGSVGFGEVLFDQGFDPDHVSLGIFSDTQNLDQEAADDFTPLRSASLGWAAWWGYYHAAQDPLDPGAQVSFLLRIYTDSLSDPVGEFAVAAQVSETASAFGGDRIYGFAADFDGPLLTAGVPYYFSAQESSPAAGFAWAPRAAGTFQVRNENGGWFTDARGDLAFRLRTTPEPAGAARVALLAVALLASRAGRRKRAGG